MEKTKKNIPALRFPQFEGEWKTSLIQDLFTFKNGLNKEKEYFGKGIPIINFTDVYKLSKIHKDDIKGLVDLSDKEIQNYSAKKGDVFFTRTSETIEDIGMSATLVEDIENCVFSGFVLRARPKNNNLVDSFKSYCFQTYGVRKEIVTKSSFTTRALTSGTLLNKVVFLYPKDREEQKKIANFLTATDKRIELLQKKKDLCEQYKKAMMQKLFSQELRFKDENGKDFPKWEVKRLGSLCNIDKGTQLNRSELTVTGSYPCINGGINPSGYTESYNTLENTITISEGGNSCGYVNLITSKFWCGGHCYTIVHKSLENSSNSYLYHYLKFVEAEIMRLRVGSGLPNIQKKDLIKFKVKRPSFPEQKKIADFLTALDKKIELVGKEIEQSEQFKKYLLQNLFV